MNNAPYRRAVSPNISAWVDASAGTGKTKILVDRIINLLLHGAEPTSIVCITFTKAAANEMYERVQSIIEYVGTCSASELEVFWHSLNTTPFCEAIVEKAKHLYHNMRRDGVKVAIKTIHSLSQRLLQSYPDQSSILPGFSILSESDASELLRTAMYKHPHLVTEKMMDYISLKGLERLLHKSSSHRDFMETSSKRILLENALNIRFTDEYVYKLPKSLSDLGERDESLFLRKDGELFSRCPKIIPKELRNLWEEEKVKFFEVYTSRLAHTVAQLSYDFFSFSEAVYASYKAEKSRQNCMDYNDIIHHAVSLLKANPEIAGYIQHILVDEAQDTSIKQWDVIKQLISRVLSQEGTLFVVGDKKQSIYGFQGADPAYFDKMKEYVQTLVTSNGGIFYSIDISVSFRSSIEVIAFVNRFVSLYLPAYMHEEHKAYRGVKGHVSIWPLQSPKELEKHDVWPVPKQQFSGQSSQRELAQRIALTIRTWINTKKWVECRSRIIEPKDIMILVRQRDALMHECIKALQELNVPVSGIDRFNLLEEVAVKDMLALAAYALCPEDKWSKALILKGPFFQCGDQDLKKKVDSEFFYALQNAPQGTFAFFSFVLHACCGARVFEEYFGSAVHAVIDEFMLFIQAYEEKQKGSLQEFMAWVQGQEVWVKRETHADNAVRVLTIHGAKGLQAPIVFLPDTTRTPREDNELSVQENGAVLWLPHASFMRYASKSNSRDEYMRLLYVALTRAEDEIYITGVKTRAQTASWYALLSEIMSPSIQPEALAGYAPVFTEKKALPKSPYVPNYAPLSSIHMRYRLYKKSIRNCVQSIFSEGCRKNQLKILAAYKDELTSVWEEADTLLLSLINTVDQTYTYEKDIHIGGEYQGKYTYVSLDFVWKTQEHTYIIFCPEDDMVLSIASTLIPKTISTPYTLLVPPVPATNL